MPGMGALLCAMRDVGAVDVCSGACVGNFFRRRDQISLDKSVKKAREKIKNKKAKTKKQQHSSVRAAIPFLNTGSTWNMIMIIIFENLQYDFQCGCCYLHRRVPKRWKLTCRMVLRGTTTRWTFRLKQLNMTFVWTRANPAWHPSRFYHQTNKHMWTASHVRASNRHVSH